LPAASSLTGIPVVIGPESSSKTGGTLNTTAKATPKTTLQTRSAGKRIAGLVDVWPTEP